MLSVDLPVNVPGAVIVTGTQGPPLTAPVIGPTPPRFPPTQYPPPDEKDDDETSAEWVSGVGQGAKEKVYSLIGSKTTLICPGEVAGGVAKIEWHRKDGRPLPPGARQVKGLLEFPDVGADDEGVYTCTVVTTTAQGAFQVMVEVTLIVTGTKKI